MAENFRSGYVAGAAGTRGAAIDEGLRAHMNKVYGTMSVGMVITALAAWAISGLAVTTDVSAAAPYQVSEGKYLTEFGALLYTTPLRWVLMFLPLIMVFAFGAAVNRLSASAAQLFFYVFATLMGVSISWIFLSFTGTSIVQTFLITAIAFASLSLWGYTTKKDISGWGSFLMMGLIGLIAAMIINMIIMWATGSTFPALQFAISVLGVLIFAGLTAYDTQNIKNTYLQMAHMGDQEWLAKSAIMGALNLYLDFINMFMFLLQLLGSRE